MGDVRKKSVKKEIKKSVSKRDSQKKTLSWMDEYKDLYTQKRMPVSVLYLEALAKDLMDWGRNPDALLVEQFYDEKGIDPQFPAKRGWFDRCPALKAAHACARRMIGYRRELGMMRGKLLVGATIGQMVQYSKAWKKVEEWRNSLKIKANESIEPTVFNVNAKDLTTRKKK